MQITRNASSDVVELKVEGRLDGYWADHLATALDQEIRQGAHHIRVDLSQVPFLSSAGIGVLVKFYRELNSIQGSFAISNCSQNVLKVLALSHLQEVLVSPLSETSPTGMARTSGGVATSAVPLKVIERGEATYELYSLSPESKLDCKQLGDATLLDRGAFTKDHCATMQFSDSSFAIGLGALGEHFDDCQARFGEFIAVGGAVAYLPTDGTNAPDFLLAHGTTLPDVQVCYGLACYGSSQQPFSSLIRFEAKKSNAPIPLSLLVDSCLSLSDAEQIGIVMIAESAGLIGAALRRSPVVAGAEGDLFQFPGIRDWLSFTAERSHTRSVVLLAGIGQRGTAGPFASVTRPLSGEPTAPVQLAGHFHAAAFSYRPVQKGYVDLKTSIKGLFEGQVLEGVLHLLTDDRVISTGRESELVRGACWIAPISPVAERAQG
jgi:anti-anti-sigma factor